MTAPASADIFHYRNLLIGDRATGFGGAYVALSDDTAGLFYNPAGIVYTSELQAATINVLSRSTVEYEDFFPDGGSLRSVSSGLVPSYFGLIRLRENYAFGFSIAVPDFLSERQLDRSSFDVGADFVNEYLTADVDTRLYNAGPSFAMRFHDGWSLGITLYGSYRDLREAHTIGGSALRPDPGDDTATDKLDVLTSYRIDDTQYGLRPLLGVQYRAEHYSAGLTVTRDFGIHRAYHYFYRSSRNLVKQNSDGTTDPEEVLDIAADSDSTTKQQEPWQLAAGAAMEVGSSWHLSAQVDHYFAVGQAIVTGSDENSPPVTRQFRGVTDVALGAEYRPSAVSTLHAAIFTDRANTNVDDPGAFERREEINLLGIALGGTYRDSVREFKFGIYYSGGKGKGTLGDLGELNFSGQSEVDARARNLTLQFGVEL